MTISQQRGFTLIELMVVVAIVMVISVFSLLEARRVRMNVNDTAAAQVIRSLAIATELYAVKNQGVYPADLDTLVEADPPYFYENICDEVARRGYLYTCSFLNGYTIEAVPQICGQTGTKHLTAEAGLRSADAGCEG